MPEESTLEFHPGGPAGLPGWQTFEYGTGPIAPPLFNGIRLEPPTGNVP